MRSIFVIGALLCLGQVLTFDEEHLESNNLECANWMIDDFRIPIYELGRKIIEEKYIPLTRQLRELFQCFEKIIIERPITLNGKNSEENCDNYVYEQAKGVIEASKNFINQLDSIKVENGKVDPVSVELTISNINEFERVLELQNAIRVFFKTVIPEEPKDAWLFFIERIGFLKSSVGKDRKLLVFPEECYKKWHKAVERVINFGHTVEMFAGALFGEDEARLKISEGRVALINRLVSNSRSEKYIIRTVPEFMHLLPDINNTLAVEGKTYIQLRNLFNYRIINNETYPIEGDYKNLPINNHKELFDKCNGKESKCKMFTAMTSKRENGYSYNVTMHGCMTKNISIANGLNFSSSSDTEDRCSFCFCLCQEDNKQAIRYFDRRPAVSTDSIEDVITGISFHEHNGVIYPRIQTARIKEGGVLATKPKWQTIKYLTPNELDDNVHVLGENIDSIQLTDVILPKDHVITGVKFEVINNTLDLRVRSTPYTEKYGISPNKSASEWQGRCDIQNINPCSRSRLEIELEEPDQPLLSQFNYPEAFPNQFVRFQTTDFSKDLGRTIVPFLDARDTVATTPRALSGLGLVYRGARGYGGYISFKFLPFVS